MKMDETEYTELYMELEKYEKRGIDMLLDGKKREHICAIIR